MRTSLIKSILPLLTLSGMSSAFPGMASENANLTVDFPGLWGVHTEVRASDGVADTVGGAYIASHNWKSNGFSATVPAELLDLKIRKGAATLILDDVDCSSGTCLVDDIIATLNVSFEGMHAVHTDARVPDGIAGSASGGTVNSANWKTNSTSFNVLRQVYDVRMRRGADQFVIDNVDCTSGSCSIADQGVDLNINFPGLHSVHTDVRIPDGGSGVADGSRVTSANWKRDQTKVRVFPKIYDLRMRHGSAVHVIDNVDCSGGSCDVPDFVSDLTINFNGLHSVHTDIRLPDGNPDTAIGDVVTRSNWKRDSTTVRVFPQVFDLRIRHGSAVHLVNNVDCSNGDCEVANVAKFIRVEFPGMSSVHTDVYPSDGIANAVSGSRTTAAYWKSQGTQISTLPGVYDLRIRRGGGTFIIDDVDCTSSDCDAGSVVKTLSVSFPGLSSVHTEVFPADGLAKTVSGNKVSGQYWKNNSTQFNLFPGIYDVKLRRGSSEFIVDNVNCNVDCSLDDLTTSLQVNFNGLSSVHTEIFVNDGQTGTVSGSKVTGEYWKSDSTNITLFPGVYDIRIRRGSATHVVDAVDCTSESCSVDGLTNTMKVAFDGMSSVHTEVYPSDGVAQEVSGSKAVATYWKRDATELTVFPGIYDVKLRKGGATYIVDDVDCTAGLCDLGNVAVTMNIDFDGLSSVHTSVHEPDGVASEAGGSSVTSSNWKSNGTTVQVFPKIYDVKLRKGAASHIIDELDCTSGSCSISDVVATISLDFEGLSSVHTDVTLPDGIDNSANGEKVTSRNWQSNNTTIKTFRQVYDLRLRKGASTHIVDNVDCSSGNCEVNDLVITLAINFPGMSSVHTDVRVADGNPDSAEGEKVTSSNWKTNGTSIKLFPGTYDLKLRKGASSHVVDNVDCSNGDCEVNDLVSTLTINFPGLSSVHTAVHLADSTNGEAKGEAVTHANWKTDSATLKLFPNVYDLRIRKGGGLLVVDNVNCEDTTCQVDDLTANMTVRFPGLVSVHTDVRVPDGIANSASGEVFTKSNWRSHETSITVFRQVYDLYIRHGATTVFDDVDCQSGICEAEIVGNVQMTLVNGDTAQPISGKYVKAYEKLPDTSLVYVTSGTTSSAGKIHFTLPDIDNGKVYVLKTWNPLGNGRSYYSPFLTQSGPLQFVVTKDGENTLDLVAPSISLDAPLDGSNVSLNGFLVSGLATDNRSVDSVTLNVTTGGITTPIVATYVSAASSWSAQVPSNLLTAGVQATLRATATDPARNATTSTAVTVTPIVDTQGPAIAFTSHADGDSVPVTGFLLSGTVTDLTGVTSLTATLLDQNGASVFTDQAVDHAQGSGAWTLAVLNGQVVEGETVSITLNAMDIDGNTATESISLNIVASSHAGWQLLNRTSFGITRQSLLDLANNGLANYIDNQLAVTATDINDFETSLGLAEPTSTAELQTWTLLHMVSSPWQLLEVMTWFWDNHFNTDIRTMRMDANGNNVANSVAFELAENRAFRTNALGNFGDLLRSSAQSPSMLIYLDSISNVVGDSNENYSREVMELGSLGVEDLSTPQPDDSAYSEADVAASAELFTGWHIQNDVFFFDPLQHNESAQTVMGQVFDQAGVLKGEAFLDMLARHPSTAYHVCTKLTQLLVNDVPPQAMVDRCATAFLANVDMPDQIAQVLRTLLSNEFFDIANYRAKIKTPVEFIVGALRNLEASTDATDLTSAMGAMGLSLYQNPVPTGYSEIGDDWINSSLLIERLKWVNDIVRQPPGASGTGIDPLVTIPATFQTAEGIVGYLLNITMGDDFTEEMRTIAVNLLQGVNGFDINDADADERLRQVFGIILSYPNFQFQ